MRYAAIREIILNTEVQKPSTKDALQFRGERMECAVESTPHEARDIAGVRKRNPYTHRRQGNRWDQYGESSSAASSEAHVVSDNVCSESTWGPHESASKDKRAAQPYRLQKANKSDGHRINGVAALPDGIRLPATMTLGRRYLNGKDHNGPPRPGEP